jgi:hypothetical protein
MGGTRYEPATVASRTGTLMPVAPANAETPYLRRLTNNRHADDCGAAMTQRRAMPPE